MAFLGYNQPAEGAWETAGKGLAQVLESLGNRKAQNIKTQSNQQLLQGLGIRPEVAAPLSRQSDEFIGDFIKQYEGFNIGGNPQPQQQAPNYAVSNNPQQIQGQGSHYNQNQPNYPQDIVQKQPFGDRALEALRGLQGGNQGQSGISPAAVGQLLQNQSTQQALHPNAGQGITPTGIRPKGAGKFTETLQHEEFKDQLKEQHEARKESREYLKELNKEYKSSKENDMRLDKMEKLIETGRLSPAWFSSSLNTLAKGIFGVGIDFTSALTPETQEFNKLSNDFVKGAKSIFGSRITDNDLKVFMNTVPNVGQSNEAKQRVIENLRIFNKGTEARQQAAKSIIQVNDGKIPANLDILVEEVVSPRLDELAEEFKNIEVKEVAPAYGHAYKAGQYQKLKKAGTIK